MAGPAPRLPTGLGLPHRVSRKPACSTVDENTNDLKHHLCLALPDKIPKENQQENDDGQSIPLVSSVNPVLIVALPLTVFNLGFQGPFGLPLLRL